MLEDERAVVVVHMHVEPQAWRSVRDQAASVALRTASGSRRRSLQSA